MFKEERQSEILKILSTESYSTVVQLAQKLYTSPSSIRRDITALQKKGLVKRSYGGVEIVSELSRSLPSFSFHKQKNVEVKRGLARAAAALVKDGFVVFLDGSSSCYYLAEQLARRKSITVITNNLDSASVLARSEVTVYCTGGLASSSNKTVLVGSFAEGTVSKIHADIFFFSPLALSNEGLVFDDSEEENSLRRVMFENSDTHVLLLSSDKLGKSSVFAFCDIGDTHLVISDADVEKELKREYTGVKFIRTEREA